MMPAENGGSSRSFSRSQATIPQKVADESELDVVPIELSHIPADVWVSAREEEAARAKRRVWIFVSLVSIITIINIDNGIIHASLMDIQDLFGLNDATLGLLGALVYIGILSSCPPSAWLLANVQKQRLILSASLAMMVICLLLFAFTPAGNGAGNIAMLFI